MGIKNNNLVFKKWQNFLKEEAPWQTGLKNPDFVDPITLPHQH